MPGSPVNSPFADREKKRFASTSGASRDNYAQKTGQPDERRPSGNAWPSDNARFSYNKNPKSLRNRKLLSLPEGLRRFLSRKKGTEAMRLARLWVAWGEVLGPELSQMVKPLGNRERTLLLLVEDSMVMQEVHYQLQTILRLVNDYLGVDDGIFFTKAQLSLPKGKKGLDSYQGLEPHVIFECSTPEPPGLERIAGQFDPDSPIGRCFNAYLNYFKTRK